MHCKRLAPVRLIIRVPEIVIRAAHAIHSDKENFREGRRKEFDRLRPKIFCEVITVETREIANLANTLAGIFG